jgi:hypothetical protein
MATPQRQRLTSPAWWLILVLLAAGWFAAQRGIADVAGYLLLESLEARTSQRGSEPYEPGRLREAGRLFRAAFVLTPHDPELLQHGGRLYEWRSMTAEGGAAATADLAQAIDHYRASLRIRPAWPYTWLDLATAKARGQQFDHEFQTAFAAALRFGPWETQVQHGAVQLALSSWGGLSAPNREQLRRLLERMAGTAGMDVLLRDAGAAQRLPVLCVIAEGIEAIDRYCEQKGI